MDSGAGERRNVALVDAGESAECASKRAAVGRAESPRGYSSSPAALQRRRQSKGVLAVGLGAPLGHPAVAAEEPVPQQCRTAASAASPHDMLSPRASPRLNVSLATHSPGPTPSSPSNGHPSAAGLGAGGAGVPQIFVSTATGSSPSTVVHALANSSLSSSAAPGARGAL
ncbi:hypothetical protein DIPPA_07466 [Diplonema papillatum]|nr:hypothetical protein DIPPA_07466 [Diplonema papillatum]